METQGNACSMVFFRGEFVHEITPEDLPSEILYRCGLYKREFARTKNIH
jgi:hypothetical protein